MYGFDGLNDFLKLKMHPIEKKKLVNFTDLRIATY